ncbi:MAG: adenylate/guanylate cyclase domain-containing protein [Spirochaetales bacterium]|nr:adenylate/guanylate cyclase domain-containing protein [Spirochaetales bacterium]
MPTKSSTQILNPNIRLLVTKGNDQGKVYETNNYPFVIGRDDSADFALVGDNNISRKHAQISLDDYGSVYIEDLNSTNGCFVNNVRIFEKTELQNGNTIIVGNTWLKFIIFIPGLTQRSQLKSTDPEESSTFFTETKKVEAILILDLFDSSRMANMFGDEIAMKITQELNSIALPIFNKYNSEFYKGTGDGYLVTFKKPEEALSAAADILKKVNSRNTKIKDSVEMHIRICLNFGQVTIEPNGDRHGNAVNIAFRVEGVQYRDMKKKKDSINAAQFPVRDRIFLTEDFLEKMEQKQKKKVLSVGSFKLKGISGMHTVYHYPLD